jgi:hypothetical protein
MLDATQYNVRDESGRLLCPACGFPDYSDEPPYDKRGGLIGMALCHCCLWEPGFDDAAAASAGAGDTILLSLRRYREGWSDGAMWQGQLTGRPPEWDGRQQLLRLFEVAPHVR